MKKTIVTSALPYVNNVPHLGNLIGSILSADVYARYLRQYSDHHNILFIGGVDEYGTATEIKARELNMSCKELCDKNGFLHKEIYDWFMISFDCYGNTSQPNGNPSIVMDDWPQTKITHEIFKNLCDKDYIIEQTEDVMYCEALDTFVADRFVIGTCRFCKSEKADGDQCDACGKLLSPSDVINPRYKPEPNLLLEIKQTTNLYIDTNKIWQECNMNDWYDNVSKSWSKNAIDITNEWLKIGLKPRSISRDLKWGTKIPETPQFGAKYDSKVFYVWFDAPIGYISISENSIGVEKSGSFWKDHDTTLIQFMAKDNVPFHSVIFPVTLFGSEYAKPNINIASTEYLLFEGGKFSKSKNTGLFCDDVMNISIKLNIPPDYWRAYLISIRPETGDSNFVLNGDTGFVGFVNNILIKNFGNLIFRILSIAYQIKSKHNITEISNNEIDKIDKNDQMNKLHSDCENIIAEYHDSMDKYSLMGGLRASLKYSSRLNQNISDVAPWVYLKNNNDTIKLYEYMYIMYTHVDHLLKMMYPFMPSVCDKIRNDFHFDNKIILPDTKPNIPISALENIII